MSNKGELILIEVGESATYLGFLYYKEAIQASKSSPPQTLTLSFHKAVVFLPILTNISWGLGWENIPNLASLYIHLFAEL